MGRFASDVSCFRVGQTNKEGSSVPIPEIPESFNAVTAFIDSHMAKGRGDSPALRWRDQVVTYAQLAANVNRVGNALLRLGIRPEERVVLIAWDSPPVVYSFWGAMKIGAVPVPINTFLRTDEYTYVLDDSGASALIVSAEIWPTVASLASRRLRHRIVIGKSNNGALSLQQLMEKESSRLEAEHTHRDDMALWLYSSGSTGSPKGVIHLHRDLLYCAEPYAK
jgi:benzoate-CoA ligase